ncbi:hypothetical protein CesoFtcFv8_008818 [Champsocephalus esox]|uniref:Uncharacterized protein n=2 Tax=Champsocephalus TaxID=52236 RepID=A0AAN8DR20_CHAGU|nr:hypothetical protein CesoFtcFv8_008818 [Champsocephalus esox]KAK5926425.1 hypothetical protein CgunFtcFv8_021998 [Champsocephalus gunnari]
MEETRSEPPEPAVKQQKLLNPSLSNEVKQDTFAAPSVLTPETEKESGTKDASGQSINTEDKCATTLKSENRDIEEDEEFSTSLSVGDGRYLVDLGSSSEFIVDVECLLQLLKTCRECNRRCTVRKQVIGLKLMVNQSCCFCSSSSKWTNLLDDDEEDFQIN